LNVEAGLVPGAMGVFDVVVDGRRVYSRAETGRFPEPAEIIQKIGP
jgi:selT/selW/selH-like putative selenoprotein